MADEENLGPASTWQVRNVPETISKAIVDRAHAERVPVGEVLTRMVLGGEGPAPVQANLDAQRLLTLLQAAALVEEGKGLHSATKAAAKVWIGHEIRGMRRVQRQALASSLKLLPPA